jgi:P4 family phage/plasmid primase-like protien
MGMNTGTADSKTESTGTLLTFLQSHRCPSGEAYTHSVWGHDMYKGSYKIDTSQMPHLHRLMAEELHRNLLKIAMTERVHGATPSPFRVDIDIKYTLNEQNSPEQGERAYTRILDELIGGIMSALYEAVEVPEDQKTRFLYVMEKDAPTVAGDGTYKDGIHLVMPHVIVTPRIMEYVRGMVLDELKDLIGDMKVAGFNVQNSAEDIYDEAVIARNGWMMYGCCKPGCSPYRVTSIWNGAPDDQLHKYTESEADDQPKHVRLALAMLFQKRDTKLGTEHDSAPSYAEQFMGDMSVLGYTADNALPHTDHYEKWEKQQHSRSVARTQQRRKNGELGLRSLAERNPDVESFNREMTFIVRLVKECLSNARVESYSSWSQLGWCLFNIHNEDDTLLEAFIEKSEQCTKYVHEARKACSDLWERARSPQDNRPKLAMGSLCNWAKADNEALYRELLNNNLDRLLEKCCDIHMPQPKPTVDREGNVKDADAPRAGPWDNINWYLVEVMCKIYGEMLVCVNASSAKGCWWEYKNDKWTDVTEGPKNYLSVDVHNVFVDYADRLKSQLEDIDPAHKERRSNIERRCQAAISIASNTRNPKSKGKIYTESLEQFSWNYRAHVREGKHSKNFEELLDTNLYLVGLENGVYDLKTHAFRPGACDDMISRSTGNRWHKPELGWNDPKVLAIQRFLRQVLPDKETRDYVVMLFASFLDGKVREFFHIFVGCGGNGKSKLIDLFTAAFGQSVSGGGYCGNLPTSALTGKRGCSSGPSPEFARLCGVRFVVVQEPETKDRLQAGRLKELTGGDTIQARALHKAPIEFKPQFGIVMASNVLPKVPGDDGGVWRRMRVVRFNSKFRREPVPDDPNEFPIDEDLTEKLELWKEAFFWMLTQYYKVLVKGDHGEKPILHYEEGEARKSKGLPKCDYVKRETSRYQSQCDPINNFILKYVNSNLPTEEIKSATLTFEDLWERYEAWCKSNGGQHADQDDLQRAMETRFDIMEEGSSGSFRGWRKIRLFQQHEIDAREKKEKESVQQA